MVSFKMNLLMFCPFPNFIDLSPHPYPLPSRQPEFHFTNSDENGGKGSFYVMSSLTFKIKEIITEPNSGMAWYVYDKGMSVHASLLRNDWKISRFGRIRLKGSMECIFNTAIVPFDSAQINFTKK